MKIHTVFITHNRLDLTKRAIASYLETVAGKAWIQTSIVDNASTDGTPEWILDNGTLFHFKHLLFENRYPGYATNLGWSHTWDGWEFLHRADNDFIFLPGWCEEVERMFSENERLGQLGMRTDEQESWNPRNVGGNCIIRRELWDEGLRYDERPWPKIKTIGYTEDSYMSPEVIRMGWEWDRVERQCIQDIETLEYLEDNADYYDASWKARGIYPERWK